MKKARIFATLVSLVALITIGSAGCNKSSQSGSNQQASFKNRTTKKQDVKSTILKSNQLWYVAGNLKSKSNSGLEAYRFNKNGKATVYNVNKIYKSYSAAQKANALNKSGTLQATFKTKGNRTVIHFKGKLSDIPMTQKFTVKKTLTGTDKTSKVKVAGYHIARDVDADVTQAVFVEAAK